jgi:hypothetical protein
VEAHRRSVVGSAIQVVSLVLLLAILGGVLVMLFAVASLLNVSGQVAGGVGSGLGGAAAQVGRGLSGAEQAVRNVTDPTRPPTGLVYDTEFNSLQVWRIGEDLPSARDYVVRLQEIRRREGADSPDTALYAVVHAELRQPRETRIFGQVIRSDRDPHDHIVYKGETFRIGRALYRANWISQEDGAIAAGVYRQPDAVSAPLKFAYD